MIQSKHQLKEKRKETTTENYENSIVLAENGKGVQEPLVLKETAPKVEGVLILCEGGDNITIKEAISKAVRHFLMFLHIKLKY